MYFDVLTGELTETRTDRSFVLALGWFPYHNLAGKYVGFKTTCTAFKCHPFAKIVDGIQIGVKTYEEMDW